jgi:hypothetical protein
MYASCRKPRCQESLLFWLQILVFISRCDLIWVLQSCSVLPLTTCLCRGQP